MEDPVERRKRMLVKVRRPDPPELTKQVRRFQKAGKVRVPKEVKAEVDQLKTFLENIRRLEDKLRAVDSLKTLILSDVTARERTIADLRRSLETAEAELYAARLKVDEQIFDQDKRREEIEAEIEKIKDIVARYVAKRTVVPAEQEH